MIIPPDLDKKGYEFNFFIQSVWPSADIRKVTNCSVDEDKQSIFFFLIRSRKMGSRFPVFAFVCLIVMSGSSAQSQNFTDTPITSYILPGWYLECSGIPDKLVTSQNHNVGGTIDTFWLQFSDKTAIVLTYTVPGVPIGKAEFACGVAIVDGASIKLSDGPALNWNWDDWASIRLDGKVSLPTKDYSINLPIHMMVSIDDMLNDKQQYDLSRLEMLLQATK